MSRPLAIGARTRLAAVLGWPVSHSKSPALHNAAFAAAQINAVYVAMAVAPLDLPNVVTGLRAISLLGASVTVPHKQAILPLCDELSDAAQAIGAVNTLAFRSDGKLVGHNTDGEGYVRAFEEATSQTVQGKRVLVLGGGGAARAVAYGVRQAGASSVQIVVRSPTKVTWQKAFAWTDKVLERELPGADVLIDCTSMGLDVASEAAVPPPLRLALLPDHAIVSTLVYHRETALLRAARERGLLTVDGAGMLVHQGALAFTLWTGAEAPLAEMARAMSE